MTISVEFIEGMSEEISGISLRKRPNSDTKIVVLSFERLVAAEGFKSFGNKVEHLWLKDEEGTIQVSPNGMKFIFVDDDELSNAECTFEVHSQDQFDRVMRFFHRYADAYGFEFQGNRQ
ncbi:photosystem II reaction center protein Psb28 [Roseofilum reptotaenium CS-1145]|uniref:Photosystem II reaction center Psb28 protein n=1 Tax=Roseofilum reptotaenium AO1-A TaxID=1925591 RepID=A0A1L9QPN6_9CYAN|nr:photosystem II reaction center protein Psb28 [Roseofilum sp. Guam]MBP0030338.1 photosystem II reaction center protein Psb28 [Roseofilum sp. Guam]MDB9515804.1 photosystem II reaction center protein Psb28 [Roseofilum reptotaenium CS-1145]OJJ24596.1 photosystem II reaction center protein Psb28 [Roseofilum reptotaenium AO1-A]